MRLTSEAFENGGSIPQRHTADGEGVSPPMAWEKEPEGTQELVLFCTDQDVRFYDEFIQWIVYKIPPGLGRLPEGLPKAHEVGRPRVLQGDNDKGVPGWLPPKGKGLHRYTFALHAVDRRLDVGVAVGKGPLLRLMEGHVIQTAELHAGYES